jgi:DNA-binding MarR family transcriptional regulator
MVKQAIEISAAAALAMEIQKLSGKLKRRLRGEGAAGDLTQSQIAVLSQLDHQGPTTVTALARMEGVRSQSMGATVATLEALGFVKGTPDPNDGRQTILSLTPSCVALIKKARASKTNWLLQTIEQKLTPREQDQLAAALKLLHRLLDP